MGHQEIVVEEWDEEALGGTLVLEVAAVHVPGAVGTAQLLQKVVKLWEGVWPQLVRELQEKLGKLRLFFVRTRGWSLTPQWLGEFCKAVLQIKNGSWIFRILEPPVRRMDLLKEDKPPLQRILL